MEISVLQKCLSDFNLWKFWRRSFVAMSFIKCCVGFFRSLGIQEWRSVVLCLIYGLQESFPGLDRWTFQVNSLSSIFGPLKISNFQTCYFPFNVSMQVFEAKNFVVRKCFIEPFWSFTTSKFSLVIFHENFMLQEFHLVLASMDVSVQSFEARNSIARM